MSKHNMPYFVLAATLLASDQISKSIVSGSLHYGERLNVIPSFFDWTLVYNPGAAFSFLANAGGWQAYFFTGLAILVSLIVGSALWRRRLTGISALGGALIAGGALGNAIDRIIHGHVIDFILVYWKNYYYPAFNLADCGITLGAILLIADEIRTAKKKKGHKA